MATADGDSVAAAGDPKIDGLLEGSQWDFGTGAHLLTYSFNLSGVPGAGGWTAVQMQAARNAFAAWSKVADIQFKEVKSGTYFYQSTADIALSLTGHVLQDKEGAVGAGLWPDDDDVPEFYDEFSADLGFPLNANNYPNPLGDIFFDNIKGKDVDFNNFAYLNPGGYSLEVMLHEIGHALGLKHPHDDDNGKPTFSELGIGNLDNDYNTVMSYTNNAYYINVSSPSTPMPIDILAMQYLYGVNRTTNTGDNTYYLRSNGTVGAIWDAGGYDTVDASSLNGGITLDLRPGAVSVFHAPGDDGYVSGLAMSYTPTETQNGPVAPIDNLIERGIGTSSSDWIYGNDANNTLLGGGGNDTLQDGTGNDTLNGGAGADWMVGGVGDDTYVMDNPTDTIVENANEGNDTVKTSVYLAAPIANVENYIYTGTSTLSWNLGGGDENNYFVTGAGKDMLAGGGGDDTLNGGANADLFYGGTGDDTFILDNLLDVVIEGPDNGTDTVKSSAAIGDAFDNVENYLYTGAANWTFTGNAEDNEVTGNSGKDTLTGGDGNDTLNGGANADKLAGGQGDDTYYLDNAGDVVVEAIGGGTDLIKSSVTLNLSTGTFLNQELENVTLTGTAAINVAGNAIDNQLIGNDGANVIDGGVGKDAMAGGRGNDTYMIDDADDAVAEDADAGNDTIVSSVLIAGLTDNVENYTYSGGQDWTFTGSDVGNKITGGSGKDALDGGLGADTLKGGLGDDTYYVDNAGDNVIEAAKQGHDTIISSIGLNLAAGAFIGQEIEDVALAAGGDVLDLTGNALTNTLTGNDGDNVLNGGAGADIMTGGLGDDTYVIDNAKDQVVEDADGGSDTVRSAFAFTKLIDNIESYVYTGSAAWTFSGTSDNNLLGGGSGKDTLYGLEGDDTLNGGAGADILTGDLGDDTYVLDNIGDQVTELAGQGDDTIQASISINLSAKPFASQEIEKVVLTGTAALTATGNALDNTLTGNAGANILDGGSGGDTLIGGLGNDTYVIDNAGDTAIEDSNAGTDTVKTSIAFNTAIDNVENYLFTGSGDWDFTGNDLNNAITGGAGKDSLDGGAGADTLSGGLGDDTYYVDKAGDKVIEAAKHGTDMIISSVSLNLAADAFAGQEIENVTLTGSDDINVTGNTLSNTLTGNDGDNVIDGGAGADIMTGGLGDDTYVIDNIKDVVNEDLGGGSDTIRSAIAFSTFVANIENYVYTGALAWSFDGNDADNTLTGGKGKNTLRGGDGDDTLTGGALIDTLAGDDGDDILNGGAGADVMTGGLGNDTYVIDNVSDKVTELAGQGDDTIQSSIAVSLTSAALAGQEIENVVLTGTAALNASGNALDNHLTGNAGANTLSGGDGNDTLDGAAGADTLIGGTGNDTYMVDNAGDKITELAGQGIDTIRARIDIDLAAGGFAGQEIENVTLIDTAALKIAGNALSNHLIGNDGANIIDGRGGADRMAGGLGDDTYYVDNAGDAVIETADEGTDTVMTTVNQGGSAFDNVENYRFVGNGNWTFTGNAQDNVLTGGDGSDLLDGGSGADILIGNGGNDTYVIDNAGDRVQETSGHGTDTVISSISIDLTAQAFAGQEVENITLTGSDDLTATGNKLNNVITGTAGDNILAGGGGADTLIGGDGDDTYLVTDAVNTKVVEKSGGGTDLIITSVSISLSSGSWVGQEIENVTVAAGVTAAISITGNALGNALTGNAAANTLDGGAGADTLIGGDGDDAYYIDDSGDRVIEATGGGIDIIYAGVSLDLTAADWLGQEIEKVTLAGNAALSVTGNGLDNLLIGNAAANTLAGGNGNDKLDGGAGADMLIGGQGDDTYIIDNAGDVVTEDSNGGNDTVIAMLASSGAFANVETYKYGGSGGWTFTGDAASNVVIGGNGNDVLNGGDGADTLTGGLGDDTYVLDNINDKIIEADGGGNDTVQSTLLISSLINNIENYTYLGSDDWSFLGTSGNNTIRGGSGNDMLYGAGGSDNLFGGDGNDTLNVGGGNYNDNLTGGMGDDTYVIYTTGSTIHESANQGNDRVIILFQGISYYMLADNVETLDMTNAGQATAYGNASDNVIMTGIGNDRLDGRAGADTMIGGSGNDTYVMDDANDVIIEADNGGSDTVISSVLLTATIANVENYSYSLANGTAIPGGGYWTFTGTAQNNTLMSTTAATLDGGGGNDVIWVTPDAGSVSSILRGGDGNDRLEADGKADDRLEGGDGDDVLNSGAGADYLDGGDGVDTADYGGGNYPALNSVTVNLADNSKNAGVALGDTLVNIENLTGTNYNDILTGNSGNNVLDGGGGSDVLTGGGGYDTYKAIYYSGVTQDVINNASGAGGPSGELDFSSGAGPATLWFSQSGQDLLVQGMGYGIASVRIQGWFGSDTSAQLAEIVTGTGAGTREIDSGGITQLVSVMAAYSASHPNFHPGTPSADTTLPNDPAILNAMAAAWHQTA